MSTSQCATDPELADPSLVPEALVRSEGASRPPKGVLIGFAATVTIGLALASWYVGVRIVDANEIAPASAAVTAPAASPVQQPPAPSGPSVPEESMAEAFWYTVPPPPPELYLEVAGLGPRKDSSFVRALEAKGYRARIIESKQQILIGPFARRSSLQAAARKLQSAGVLAVETAH
jgi:hypothetical protein